MRKGDKRRKDIPVPVISKEKGCGCDCC